MSDPRVMDAIRNLPNQMDAVLSQLSTLREDNKYLKEQLRQIKKSVVRKYGKGEADATSESVGDHHELQ